MAHIIDELKNRLAERPLVIMPADRALLERSLRIFEAMEQVNEGKWRMENVT